MKLPKDTLEHVKVGDFTLVLYRWGKLTETTFPKVWENVEFFDQDGNKLWTVNGMKESEYWDNSADTFVGIGNDQGVWILNSYSGNSYEVDLKTGKVSFLAFHK